MALRDHYRERLRATVGSSAAPYGYTLATWTSGAVLAHARGIPDALVALAFMAGAVLGFAFVGALAFGRVTGRLDRGSGEAYPVWGSFHFFSVGAAIGVAALVVRYVEDFVAWPLTAFLYTITYLLIAAAESAIAHGWDHRKQRR